MRILFPEHGRYTKKGVRAFLYPDKIRLHLVFPEKLGNPFLRGGHFIDESVDRVHDETGLLISWTPVGDLMKDDSHLYKTYEEVIL